MKTRRTTLVLPANLLECWKIQEARERVPKSVILVRELGTFLRKAGFDPEKTPRRIDVRY